MSGFLWLGLLIPAATTLWWVYRRGDTTRERVLGSIMLLERAQIISRSVKWRPPWRALIEGLLLLALITTLVNPFHYLEQQAPIVVIAIDVSPRMLVTVDRDQTRLGRAKVRASEIITQQSSGVRFVLASQHGAVGPFSAGEAQAAIEQLGVSWEESPILERAAGIAHRYNQSTVHVISEGTLGLPIPAWMRWHTVDEQPHDNIAIHLIDPVRAQVQVRSYSTRSEEVALAVSDRSGAVVSRAQLAIPAGEVRTAQFSESFPRAGAVLLSRKFGPDAFATDDVGYFVPDDGSDDIAVVSQLSPQALGLTEAQLPGYRFVAATAQKLNPYARVILHRQSIQEADEAAALCASTQARVLVVVPQAEALPTQPDAQILWWEAGEELLRYAQLDLLRLPQAQRLNALGGTALAATKAGPVIIRTTKGMCEEIVVGFELFPFSRTDNRTLGILTLNLLTWLHDSGSQGEAGSVVARSMPVPGPPWVVGSGSLEAEKGNVTRVTTLLGSQRAVFNSGESIAAPGLYQEEFSDSARKPQLRARTFYSERLSDNRTVPQYLAPTRSGSDMSSIDRTHQAQDNNDAPALRWIIVGCVVLVLIDLMYVLIFSRSRSRNVTQIPGGSS